ncbi:MAG: GNAT family N-acetyltransferase, partial [Spirochaetia bacterium]|nr:GNAT family N-acetyltransferase [Spirochaetia bacterium]
MATKLTTRKKINISDLNVHLAENQLEVERAYSLRYNVFNLELGEGLPSSRETLRDKDEYDFFCDHLVVTDSSENNMVVGTYRILRKEIAKKTIGFYSENEFDLFNIYNLDFELAEVGRSCVHPDYRDGSVITLLWKGLANYMIYYNIRYYMGCGSIHSIDKLNALNVYHYLKEKNAISEIYVPPLEKSKIIDDTLTSLGFETHSIPPLIKGYLRLGAKICGEPALDLEFGTTDFFILF